MPLPQALVVVLLALLVPPVPLIHTYLVSRAWRYVTPEQAFRWALGLSSVLTLAASAGLLHWLTYPYLAFDTLAGAMTVVCVGSAMLGALLLPGKPKPQFRLWLTLASELLALPVPLAVWTLWWGWYPLLFVLVGYWMLQRSLRGEQAPNTAAAEWLLDRGALELLAIALVGGAAALPFASVLALRLP